jgi:ABC-type nitrate/sulfonate/bicarbonate transport system ATPase subunit
MAEVIFKKLEKVYTNGFKAVHGIDLTIKDGEFMVIVGPSGCAKSTTLRMLAGLETISGGRRGRIRSRSPLMGSREKPTLDDPATVLKPRPQESFA